MEKTTKIIFENSFRKWFVPTTDTSEMEVIEYGGGGVIKAGEITLGYFDDLVIAEVVRDILAKLLDFSQGESLSEFEKITYDGYEKYTIIDEFEVETPDGNKLSVPTIETYFLTDEPYYPWDYERKPLYWEFWEINTEAFLENQLGLTLAN